MSTVAGISTAWLVARAAGLVAFGVLTLSVWLGLAHEHAAARPAAPAGAARWHRTLAGRASRCSGCTSARCCSTRRSTSACRRARPFAAPWRPAAVAAGVVAGWLMVMLAVSFRLRKRIGQRVWRRLHYASFAAFLLALCHALAPAPTSPASAARSWRWSPAAPCCG